MATPLSVKMQIQSHKRDQYPKIKRYRKLQISLHCNGQATTRVNKLNSEIVDFINPKITFDRSRRARTRTRAGASAYTSAYTAACAGSTRGRSIHIHISIKTTQSFSFISTKYIFKRLKGNVRLCGGGEGRGVGGKRER